MFGVRCFGPLRKAAAEEMTRVFQAHLIVTLVVVMLVPVLPGRGTRFTAAGLGSFVNMVWLSERIWKIQAKSMYVWSMPVQWIFKTSRCIMRVMTLLMSVVIMWLAILTFRNSKEARV